MISEEIAVYDAGDKIRFEFGGVSTGWMSRDDAFVARIDKDCLNPVCPERHIACEIRIKNILDEGISFFKNNKFPKAIERFDEVLFYDFEYVDALINKSYCLKGQGHFVKALRYYRKASRCGYEDNGYYKILLAEANKERDGFPKIKRNIYAGDEFFSKGDYENAVSSYDRALGDTSKFRDRILHKLLNKKATALLKLSRFDEARACFEESLDVESSDYAHFGRGYSLYGLGMDTGEEFRRPLRVDKMHLLRQAMILNETGNFKNALAVCDVLFESHFRVDEFYFRMLNVKMCALRGLGEDTSSVEEIFEKLDSFRQ